MRESEDAARRVEHNEVLEWLSRAGFVAYGLIHLLIAWLALEIVLGRPTEEGDQSGALQVLVRQPLGRVLLTAVVIGLAALALWQALDAAVGYRELHGARRVAERLVALARAIAYGAFGWSAVKIIMGRSASAAQGEQGTTQTVMATPGGRWLVGFAGVVVIAISIGFAWFGLSGRFERNLRTDRMTPAMRRFSTRLGQFGYAAKAAAYAIVGGLLLAAAITADPTRSRGLDAALRTLVRQPFGDTLLAVVAAGFAAFGVYCLVQARYRKM